MEACGNDIRAYFPIAVEFHKQLAMASKNKIFNAIWGIFQDLLLNGYKPILEEVFPDGPSNLLENNKLLLKAIKSKDLMAIDDAMEYHAAEEKFFATYPHSMLEKQAYSSSDGLSEKKTPLTNKKRMET